MRKDRLGVSIDGERVEVSPALLEKYNRPGPRYTSYPTAPEWDDDFGPQDFIQSVRAADAKENPSPLSLYFHIPFCESLCLYCGCNVVISKKHEVTVPYFEHLKREIDWVSSETSRSRKVEQMHWGGGTPTYLSPDQIENLYTYISDRFTISDTAEISAEVDPRATSFDHLRAMRRLGFNRVSMGIQDFDPLVQNTVRRVQPYEDTKRLYDYCRELGYESINMDLIYGLPHQTADSFSDTVNKIITMRPDRVAVFSYAHVPWMKKQQGSFARFLPQGVEKFRIFTQAVEMLTEAGYRYIGLDHFALPGDEICRAQDDRSLHRNFQGYTTKAGCDLYGMGVSSISALDDAYAQNWRDLPKYYEAIEAGYWPTMRGLSVTSEDKLRRSVINRILCHTMLVKSEVEREFNINFDSYFAAELARLSELERDGLVRISSDRIEVIGAGRIFIRNVAMEFDAYLREPERQDRRAFSKTL